VVAQAAKTRQPRWYAVPVRILLVTFILTLISFALCLLMAILGTMLSAKVHGYTPDLRLAYWHIALPIAIAAGTVVFIVTTVMEIRHYRQSRALQGIARASRK
jgi:TRAP-type C4-dicarboxylate transport system permease small subunit